ncbi:MAG TPA: DHHA1 domain-containing protein [Bacillota bacterium]|jgi:phosphoesterase RecJ-like protein|nr:hypothetical protein [Fastidiosipila sp.]HPX92927.1 DHHA1 domain-containing protein [Bacillota bacterium]HQB80683.1 DHHA1 domain-containing protein [Bacillota bacterium]
MKESRKAGDRLLEVALDLAADGGRIGLFPHERYDADAVGAAVSLSRAFRSLGCSATVVVGEPVPESLQHLPGLEELLLYNPSTCPVFDLALAIDCHEAERLGRRADCFLKTPLRGAVDHHVHQGQAGDLELIDPGAASTSELVFDMIWDLELHLGRPVFDSVMAVLLLAGTITDTGRYAYSNTTPLSLRQAASLLERFDIDLSQLNYDLFERTTMERLQIKGDILSTIRPAAGGRFLFAHASLAMLARRGAQDDELSNLASEIRAAEGAAAVFLLVEAEDGSIRVSIRSNSCFDSAAFAGRFGGGGHVKAAGMTLQGMSLQEAEELLADQAEAQLKACMKEAAQA